jgi:demethylmenaquinone methyltransferase/2-methoxy-6-polyprenyl-1,4-benzoquinol methylase
VARGKALPGCVRFAEIDAYTLCGLEGQRFDGAFAGCWWSHVPLARLAPWLELLHARLDSGARVVFLDNAFVRNSSTPLSRRDADGNTYQQRTLDDGSVHEVLKNFPTRGEAIAMLGPRARDVEWIDHAHYWILSYELS